MHFQQNLLKFWWHLLIYVKLFWVMTVSWKLLFKSKQFFVSIYKLLKEDKFCNDNDRWIPDSWLGLRDWMILPLTLDTLVNVRCLLKSNCLCPAEFKCHRIDNNTKKKLLRITIKSNINKKCLYLSVLLKFFLKINETGQWDVVSGDWIKFHCYNLDGEYDVDSATRYSKINE